MLGKLNWRQLGKNLAVKLGFYQIFLIWQRSHIDLSLYSEIKKYQYRKLIYYLLITYLLLAAFYLTQFEVVTWPKWQKIIDQTWQEVINQWPQEAEVQINDGFLTANFDQPLLINFPDSLELQPPWPNAFIKIDPHYELQNQMSDSQLHQYGLLTFSQKHLIINFGEFGHNYAWSEVYPESSLVINKNSITELQPHWQKLTDELKTSLWFSLATWHLLLKPIWRLSLMAVVFWLLQPVMQLSGSSSKFSANFKVGIVLLVITEEIFLLQRLIYPEKIYYSFWFIWLLLRMVVVIGNRYRQ